MGSRTLPPLYLLVYIFSCTDKAPLSLSALDIALASLAALALFIPKLRIGPLLILGQWLQVFLSLPETPNHELLLALYGVLWLMLGNNPQLLLRASQILMAIAYGIAGLHKLNAGFWNPEMSCLTFFAPWVKSLIPALSFLVVTYEFLLSGLLFFNFFLKRSFFLYPALLFHLLLSPLGFWDFASVAVMMLAHSRVRLTTYAKGGLVLHILIYTLGQGLDYKWRYLLLAASTWFVLLSTIDFKYKFEAMKFPLRAKVFYAVVILWGLGPYWGGPHYPTFSMFSNLQMQSVSSNSWLLEKPLLEINEDWWKVIKAEKPTGLPYFTSTIMYLDKNALLPKNSLYGENRGGQMLLQNNKTKEEKLWPQDFPLNESPSKLEKILSSRRPVSFGVCQW